MIIGVDYASVDGNAPPNFTAAKNAGLTYAILRGTYGTWADPLIQRDWKALAASGLVRGAYMFPIYTEDPVAEAKAFAAAVGPLGPGDLPPILDIEFPGHGISDTKMTPAQAVDWLTRAGTTLMESYGCCMIYTSGRVWHEDLQDAMSVFFQRCPKWLARYTYGTNQAPHLVPGLLPGVVPPQLGDPDDYDILQVQGDAIQFPGFTHTVDINIWRPLLKGAKGARCAWLADRLGLPVSNDFNEWKTHVFDDQLAAAFTDFQTKNSLTPDATLGPRSFSRVCWSNLHG